MDDSPTRARLTQHDLNAIRFLNSLSDTSPELVANVQGVFQAVSNMIVIVVHRYLPRIPAFFRGLTRDRSDLLVVHVESIIFVNHLYFFDHVKLSREGAVVGL